MLCFFDEILKNNQPHSAKTYPVQVAEDPKTFISLAAVWGAVMDSTKDKDEVQPWSVFNVDVTSVELGLDPPPMVMVSPTASAKLKKANLGVTVTAPEKQYRSAKLMTIINAYGELNACVCIIKDDKLQNLTLHQVCRENIYKQHSHGSSRARCGCCWSPTRRHSTR